MYFDSHVHSAASPDSKMPPEEAIQTVRNMGMGIAFTEHVDFATHIEMDTSADDAPRVNSGDFVCDFNIYPKEYEKFRAEDVTLGLELGLTKAFCAINKKIADSYDYDTIIGGVHAVDGVDIYLLSTGRMPDDPMSKLLVSRDSQFCADYISRYLTYSKEMVELYGFFDSFAHIDYVARYSIFFTEKFLYENAPDEFDALLKTIAEREIAFEINTKQFGDENKSEENEILKICRRFKERGGKMCTIGSDAHYVYNIGRCIESAKEIAEASGLVPVYFKKRKPVRCG